MHVTPHPAAPVGTTRWSALVTTTTARVQRSHLCSVVKPTKTVRSNAPRTSSAEWQLTIYQATYKTLAHFNLGLLGLRSVGQLRSPGAQLPETHLVGVVAVNLVEGGTVAMYTDSQPCAASA